MTQVTSPDNIPSPDLTDQYALTQDMANLADGTQKALIKRANMYVGTSAQRTAFTTAPEGVHWQDTNGTKTEYTRKGGVWVAPKASGFGGLVDVNIGTGNQIAGMNIYGAVANVPVPYVAGAGEVIRITDVSRTTTWGLVTQMGPGTVAGGTTNIPIRSIVFGGSAAIQVTFLWDVINLV